MTAAVKRLVLAAAVVGLLTTSAAAAPGRTEISFKGAILYVGGPGSLDSELGYPQTAVYAVDAGGRRLKELVAGPVQDARWSPDGRLLAFLRPMVDGFALLYVVGATGGTPRFLARTSVFDWSPESRKIAYLDTSGAISVIRVGGGEPRRLVADGGRSIAWSPDGKRLAFVREYDLYVVRADGSALRRLAPGLKAYGHPSWSPDGRQLAFYPCCVEGFAVVDVRGGRVRTLGRPGVLLPAWSPDGRWIALGGNVRTSSGSERSGTFLIRPDGTRFRRISALGANPFAPAWSPDSRSLAVLDSCCSPDLWVISVDGRRKRGLTEGWRYGYSANSPQWHPRNRPTEALGGRYVSRAYPSDTVVDGSVIRTTSPIARLAADGPRVLYATEGWCEVAAIDTRSVVRPQSCGVYGSRTFGHALAGDRLASVDMSPFMGADNWSVQTSTVTVPRAVGVTFPDNVRLLRSLPVSGLEGDGELLVLSTWGPCRITYDPPCAHEPKRGGVLWKLDGERALRVASGPGAMTPLSVDAGRILVDHENGALELLRADGSSLRTFAYAPGSFLGARLQGRDLVVLTSGTVEDYDAETGTRMHEWPTAAGGGRLDDVHAGVAVYVSRSFVYLVRLSDGATVALPQLGSNPLVQLEDVGLFYAYRVSDAAYPGRVSLIPFDRLPLP